MNLKAGRDVEILGGPDDTFDVQICDRDRYFIRISPPTPTPHDSTNDTRFMVKEVQLVPASDQNFRVETEIACRAGSRGGCQFALGVNTK